MRRNFVAVVGPGAVGATLAASLLESGRRVVLLGREGWDPRRPRHAGLRVTDRAGRTRTLRGLEAAGRTLPRGACEALFLCVKSRDLPSALRRAGRLAGPKTAVISLLNGIDHAAPILRTFGKKRTVMGSCYLAAMRSSPRSVRLTGQGPVV
ncbi:MAG: 2-dehydropantoate 2-reductase, partial [Elusimicrobiota bacterium]